MKTSIKAGFLTAVFFIGFCALICGAVYGISVVPEDVLHVVAQVVLGLFIFGLLGALLWDVLLRPLYDTIKEFLDE